MNFRRFASSSAPPLALFAIGVASVLTNLLATSLNWWLLDAFGIVAFVCFITGGAWAGAALAVTVALSRPALIVDADEVCMEDLNSSYPGQIVSVPRPTHDALNDIRSDLAELRSILDDIHDGMLVDHEEEDAPQIHVCDVCGGAFNPTDPYQRVLYDMGLTEGVEKPQDTDAAGVPLRSSGTAGPGAD